MTVACTQLRQEVKDGPRAQKWALAHAGVNHIKQSSLLIHIEVTTIHIEVLESFYLDSF